jgi:rhodanese-related sulfurtransferase
MKLKKFLFRISFILILTLLFQSCLKDNVSPEVSFNLSSSYLLLKYVEDQGDYINSKDMPSIVDVDEVHNNLNYYLIIDIRSVGDYELGHIPGAINILPDSLVDYLTIKNAVNRYIKVVIVSTTGQSSSYFTCLLRLYGFHNVYSLNFGMAEWNKAFSEVWQNKLDDRKIIFNFNNVVYKFGSKYPLPKFNLKFPDSSIQQNSNQRILQLIKDGFTENGVYKGVYQGSNSNLNPSDYYIVCYGSYALYLHDKPSVTGSGHFENALLYRPMLDLKSTENLQTLPNDKSILVYSISGQQSAFVVAYLRLLGYDAKTLLYGGCNLFYGYLSLQRASFIPYVFFGNNVRSYEFVTGTSPY